MLQRLLGRRKSGVTEHSSEFQSYDDEDFASCLQEGLLAAGLHETTSQAHLRQSFSRDSAASAYAPNTLSSGDGSFSTGPRRAHIAPRHKFSSVSQSNATVSSKFPPDKSARELRGSRDRDGDGDEESLEDDPALSRRGDRDRYIGDRDRYIGDRNRYIGDRDRYIGDGGGARKPFLKHRSSLNTKIDIDKKGDIDRSKLSRRGIEETLKTHNRDVSSEREGDTVNFTRCSELNRESLRRHLDLALDRERVNNLVNNIDSHHDSIDAPTGRRRDHGIEDETSKAQWPAFEPTSSKILPVSNSRDKLASGSRRGAYIREYSSPSEKPGSNPPQSTATNADDQMPGQTISRGRTSRGKSRSDYHFHTLIGEGSLGKVYEATRIETGEQVAVKMVKKSRILHSQTLCRLVREEVRIHMKPSIIANPHIVRLISSFQDEAYLYYVFEFVKDGTLSKLLQRLGEFREAPLVPLELVRLWMAELLGVVWTLAQERVVHRDLKPDNIMLSNGHMKVIDFNSAVMVPEGATTTAYLGLNRVKPAIGGSGESLRKDTDFGGTIPWWSPERVSLFIARSHQQKSPSSFLSQTAGSLQQDSVSRRCPGVEFDLWSLGCIMYEMLVGVNPFLRATPELTAEKIMRYSQRSASIDFPSTVGPLTRNLCLKLLEPNPMKRAEILPTDKSQLLSHPFFSGFNFQSPLSQLDASHLVKTLLRRNDHSQSGNLMTPSLLEFTPEAGQAFRGREWSSRDSTGSRLRGSDRLRDRGGRAFVSPKTIPETTIDWAENAGLESIEDGRHHSPKTEAKAWTPAPDDGRETPRQTSDKAEDPPEESVGMFLGRPPRASSNSRPVASSADGNWGHQRTWPSPSPSTLRSAEGSATPKSSRNVARFGGDRTPPPEGDGSRNSAYSFSCPGSIIILRSRKLSSLVQHDALLRDAFRLAPIDPQSLTRQSLPYRRRRRTLSDSSREGGLRETRRAATGDAAHRFSQNHTPLLQTVERGLSVPLVLDSTAADEGDATAAADSAVTGDAESPPVTDTDPDAVPSAVTSDTESPASPSPSVEASASPSPCVDATAEEEPQWVQWMCSEEFREFVIEKVLDELQNLTPAVDCESEDVVSAAQILTWGPLKVRLVTRPMPVEQPPSPPVVVLSQHTRASGHTVQRAPPLLCCVRSPSYLVFNRLRRWLTPVSTPCDVETDGGPRETSPASGKAESPRRFVDLLCFGMLSGRFGLLLFQADLAQNSCRLVETLPLSGSGGRLRVHSRQPQLEIHFPAPGFAPHIAQTEHVRRVIHHTPYMIEALTLDFGTRSQLTEWLPHWPEILHTSSD